jgi:hypothetical protein
LGVEDPKVIGSVNDPDKAIIRLVELEAEGPNQKVLEQVLDKIQRKVEEARVSPVFGAELHQRQQNDYVRRSKLAQESYKREHPEIDEVNEGYKQTLEYRFCTVIYDFLLETGLKPAESVAVPIAAEATSAPLVAPQGAEARPPVIPGAAAAPAAVPVAASRADSAALIRLCPACQREVPAIGNFCPHCTAALPAAVRLSTAMPGPSHCGSCSAELVVGARGCHMCGWKVPLASVCCGSCGAMAPTGAKFCPSCIEPIVLGG